MAHKGKGRIMGGPLCEWVREWLPLLVADGEETSSEGTDLSPQDRHRIELHLDGCKPCRQRRAALEGALSLLATVAAEPPVEPGGSSVWPKLEERIQIYHARSQSRWLQFLREVWPAGIRAAVDRFSRGWGQIRDELPLRIAWLRDSVHEFLHARLTGETPVSDPSLDSPLRGMLPKLGFSLAIACLAVLIVIPLIHRRQVQADAQIAADAAPIPDPDEIPLAELREEPAAPAAASHPDSYSSETLAMADPVPVPAPPAVGQGQNSAAKPTVTVTPAPASRYDFDLEHGIPMPPDSRGSKPAY
jgi:hypothetical protein